MLQGTEFRVEKKSAGFYSEKCLLLLLCCSQLFLTNCNFSLIILPQTSYTLNWTHMTWPVWVILLFCCFLLFVFRLLSVFFLQFEQLNWQFQFFLFFFFCFFTANCTVISLCVDVFSLHKLCNILTLSLPSLTFWLLYSLYKASLFRFLNQCWNFGEPQWNIFWCHLLCFSVY